MKRTLCVILSAVISLCCLPCPVLGAETAPATDFSDVQDTDWFAPYVKVCVAEGLMQGTGEGQFSPSSPVTQAEAVMDLDTGEFVLPLGHYDSCYLLSDGYFLTKENDRNPTEPYLLRDRSGAVVASLYGSAVWTSLDCGSGLAPCYDRETGLWGYVDVSGQWVIPPQFGSYGNFWDGYVANTLERDGHWYGGVMDAQGNEVLPFQYATSLEYRGDGRLCAEPHTTGGYWVDLNGRKTANGYIAYDIYCSHGYFALGNRYLDREFRNATPKEFDWTGPIGKDGSGFVGKGGKIYRIQFQ